MDSTRKDCSVISNARYRPDDIEPASDPTSPQSTVRLFEDGFGQQGAPFVMLVSDPPDHTRAAHHHHGDVFYVYVQGEHHVHGERTYRAGDVRWVRAGHAYGPETTGPDGGSWWVLSYANPIPVDHGAQAPAAARSHAASTDGPLRFVAPFDWAAIDAAVLDTGAAIVTDLVAPALIDRLNRDVDQWLDDHSAAGRPASGSELYDSFLGHRTVRLHGLCAKFPSAANLIGHPDIVAWAQRALAPICESVLLNAGELIQIGPGEPAQFLHRDTDSWPHLPAFDSPVLVNAIVALSPFTTANGATNVTLRTHRWDRHTHPGPDDIRHAELAPGDALLFRGDIIHGGGANTTNSEHRRGVSLSYCAGWLRPVENSYLNVPPTVATALPADVQDLLGYAAHDAISSGGGLLGLYENGDPHAAIALADA
jgi:ectoine hydroxylase-related dioxygenase (phytanoyl-CoA dioxygenase family)